MKDNLLRRALVELFGTFWLVFGGVGTAVLSAGVPGAEDRLVAIALAFGLTLITMAYAFGEVSGAHFNPAVTVGVAAAGRFPLRDLPTYVAAQLVGGLSAGGAVYAIASGSPSFDIGINGLAANGYGAHSPGGFGLAACAFTELVLTFGFVAVILGATSERAPKGFAPLAIGLTLSLVHLIGLPVTNTSVNPARSTASAIFQGGWAIAELWLFWLVPVLGALLAGGAFRASTRASLRGAPVVAPPEAVESPPPARA
jgi:aquaporin Z